MRRPQTTLWPFAWPRLSDPAATQLVALLQELVSGVEYHYREQIHRHRKRQQDTRYARASPPASDIDTPF